MVLGPFAETKGPRLPGRNPATQKILVIREFEKKIHLPTNSFQLEHLKVHSDTHDMAVRPES